MQPAAYNIIPQSSTVSGNGKYGCPGVTTDSTKSGIESEIDLNIYYCIKY